MGRYDEAREAFERAAECERQTGGRFSASESARLANAHAGVAELYLAASAPARVAEELRTALELGPDYHDLRNRLGEALMQQGELDAAQEAFERTLEGNGRFLRARLNLGLVHYRRGDYDQAREHWEEGRSQDPNHPQVRAYLRLLESVAADSSGHG
jgi:tetratricopeptide (TPR) repeat protein